MPEHLAATTGRIVALAHGVKHHVQWGLSQSHDERHISIIGYNVIVADVDRQRAAELSGFVPGGRDNEMDFPLTAKQPETVINFSCQDHASERVN